MDEGWESRLLRCTENDGELRFTVRVVSRASRSEVVGELDGALRVRVSAAPVNGAANEELIKTIARALRIPRRDIEITSGHSSKIKQLRVTGVERSALDALA